MISEKLQKAINDQVKAEMWSANLYLAMSFYFKRNSYDGFANWMKKQSDEEMDHAMQLA
ncbi:MAG: ferritin-like domain-containing protein, partial [Muribaculaceae bacterium]|nr:ferritin-like domain-containing protein [Muribaculaceae bacterium]